MNRRVIIAAVLILFGGPAGAGTRFTLESRDLRQEDPRVQTSVLWLEGAHLRLEADATNSVIFRADEDSVWLIDHRAKSYRSIDRETSLTLARGVGQANTTARRYIESLPPEQRRAAERLLDQTLGTPTRVTPDIEVRASGAQEHIAGIGCSLSEVRRGGVRRAEVCRASFEAASVSGQSRNAVRALTDLLSELLPALAPERLRQDGVDALHAFAELDGVPLRVRLYEGNAASWETRVTGVVVREVPATTFDLPDGYEQNLSLGRAPPARAQPATPVRH